MIRFPFLAVAILALPFAEFAAFFAVSNRIGFLGALALVIATSVLGILILRGGARMLFAQLAKGEMVIMSGEAARSGVLAAFAGLLFAIPGFVTDALALLCLLGVLVSGRFGQKDVTVEASRPAPPGIVDLDPRDWREDRAREGEQPRRIEGR